MKVAAVLLRWYKSFNTNYTGYPQSDRRSGVVNRPWNGLGTSSETEDEFRFIEIPLESDVTTVVGANESGKSHLLSAISKVITGSGIPDGFGEGSEFSRTDLCRYTSPRSKNAEDWPNVGLQFKEIADEELKAVGGAAGSQQIENHPAKGCVLTLVLAPNADESSVAHLYLGEIHCELDKAKLEAVRKTLPTVQFIRSEVAFSDQIPIGSLLAAYRGHKASRASEMFDFAAAQQVAQFVSTLAMNPKSPTLDPAELQALVAEQKALKESRLHDGEAELELQLFRDVLGITADTIEYIAGLPVSDRTHADGQIETWNREIEERLNLSHFWTQDDSFALRLNYKQGLLHFEITDKTGSTYTFRERSSGLRFFLSYYVQAKALESVSRRKTAIVLMDEPDSFLSIIGQKNLLAVFESLVRAESSSQECQLVYTTHSPFLINRNFPQRLRLVRKGDAEEGTQLADQAMLRRYEPVRSALGIDCSQTLFMGATNVVVEGPADQLVISELIRHFSRPDNIGELLDLNALVVVSAESAPSVEKMLAASQWGDEPVPATVVLVDSDGAGGMVRDRIIGKARNCKKLIDGEYVLRVGEVVSNAHDVVTIEDLLPHAVFKNALLAYITRWWGEIDDDVQRKVSEGIDDEEFTANGFVKGADKLLNDHVYDVPRSYDKYGVLQEALRIVQSGGMDEEDESLLRNNVLSLCGAVRRAVSASQQAARRESGKQAVKRLIEDFSKLNKQSCLVFDMILLFERIQRDLQLLGEDGDVLDRAIKRLLDELRNLRSAGHAHLTAERWSDWNGVLSAIRKEPLRTSVEIEDGTPLVRAAAASATDGADDSLNEGDVPSPTDMASKSAKLPTESRVE